MEWSPPVDPFIGIEGGGNCLVGPYRPLGLVRPGPQRYDSNSPQVPNNGLDPRAPLRRFAQVHVSGAGGAGRYGNIAISPRQGSRSFEWPCYALADEVAEPGYYSVRLVPGNIRTEITSTDRSTIYRFDFPEASEQKPARVLIDGAAGLGNGSTHATDGYIYVADAGRVYGWVTLVGGWGHHHPWQTFFYIEFNRDAVDRKATVANCGHAPDCSRGTDLRVDLEFGAIRSLECRIGISFISVAKARRNLEAETSEKSFDRIRAESGSAWTRVLSRVRVAGGTREDRILHYTMLYRLLAMPGDLGIDDEFPLWHSGTRQFNDFFCLWDSCRNANAFLGLCFGSIARDIVNCLLDVARETGWMFDAWTSFHHGFQQGGCSADVLLAEAALRNLPGIDYSEALRLARRHFEEEPGDPSERGRYLRELWQVGFIPAELNARQFGAVSRQIEYNYHDACLARLADVVGDSTTAEACRRNSRQLMQLWHPVKKCFFPKHADGRWVSDFDVTQIHPSAAHHAVDPYFFEGSAVEWSLCPLHLIDEVMVKHGGPDAFVRHLDNFFSNRVRKWKEFILHTPYLYHAAGRPEKTADQVRAQRRRYHTGRCGIPDNEDMGSHATFLIATGLGLYPIMGEDGYWLSPPRFSEADLAVGMEDARLKITAEGADPGGEAPTYIVGAELDGQPVRDATIRHRDLVGKAGETRHLRIRIAEIPNGWGRGPWRPR